MNGRDTDYIIGNLAFKLFETPVVGHFGILAGATWSEPPTAALWLSAEPVARADVPFQLSVTKRAKAAALPPHSKSPTVSGPSYRTPPNEPMPKGRMNCLPRSYFHCQPRPF